MCVRLQKFLYTYLCHVGVGGGVGTCYMYSVSVPKLAKLPSRVRVDHKQYVYSRAHCAHSDDRVRL